MRVLIINVNANSGSTGKIVEGLYSFLNKKGHSVKICYRGALEDRIDNPDFIALKKKALFNITVFLTRLTGLEGHFSFFPTVKVKRLIKSFKPDVVQLYNIHGNYINSYAILKFLKKKRITVVYSMMDEYPYMGRCPYPLDCERFKAECHHCPLINEYPSSWFIDTTRHLFNKKKEIYSGFDNIIFTGPPYVCERARESTLLREKRVFILDEPFDFYGHYYPRDSEVLRDQLGIHLEDRVVICASGTSPRKNGKVFLEIARKLKAVDHLKFIFLGYDRCDWDFPDNVIVKGFISDQDELASYLSLADSYVCTSIGDTTPSVCLAALGCGTPLIGFNYGGIVDCAPNEFGSYVTIGNIDKMVKVVREVRKKTKQDIDAIREYAIGRFSQETVYSKQLELYNLLVGKRC